MYRKTFVSLLLTIFATSSVATAQGNGIRLKINYFSDASLSNQTGEYVQLCDGTIYFNGHPDDHSTYFEGAC